MVCYTALALNVLIVQSRAGVLVFILMSIIVLIAFRSHRILLVALAGLFAWLGQELDESGRAFLQQRLTSAITVNVETDASIALRSDSISHSWSMFLRDPLFGVGPGLSRDDNPFAVAHQFFAHQAAELGVLGFVASIGIALLVAGRFLIAAIVYRRSRHRWPEAVWLSGATGWLLYICLAGATLNMTIVIAWVGLFVAFLALSRSSGHGADHLNELLRT
jgi:O-antigen ligase